MKGVRVKVEMRGKVEEQAERGDKRDRVSAQRPSSADALLSSGTPRTTMRLQMPPSAVMAAAATM